MSTSKKSPSSTASRIADLEERIAALEAIVGAARQRQQQELAQRLARNPEQLAQIQAVLELAKSAKPAGG